MISSQAVGVRQDSVRMFAHNESLESVTVKVGLYVSIDAEVGTR